MVVARNVLPSNVAGLFNIQKHLSNEQNPGWLGYVGDYATQLYGEYDKPL